MLSKINRDRMCIFAVYLTLICGISSALSFCVDGLINAVKREERIKDTYCHIENIEETIGIEKIGITVYFTAHISPNNSFTYHDVCDIDDFECRRKFQVGETLSCYYDPKYDDITFDKYHYETAEFVIVAFIAGCLGLILCINNVILLKEFYKFVKRSINNRRHSTIQSQATRIEFPNSHVVEVNSYPQPQL